MNQGKRLTKMPWFTDFVHDIFHCETVKCTCPTYMKMQKRVSDPNLG